MALKLYVDRMSQPSRAVVIFCKANGIEFEEVKIELVKGQHRTPEYEAINPMKKVPAMADGTFKLFESHAIMIYLASVSPGVSEHWYPSDVLMRAKINSVLDWHHLNLRYGAFTFVFNSTIAPLLGLPLNLKEAAEGEKILLASLAVIESHWLEGSGRFLAGSEQPSIADLSLVCEIMQLMVLNDEDRDRILGPYKKVLQWIKDTKDATSPHFDEVHDVLNQVKERLQKLPNTEANVSPVE